MNLERIYKLVDAGFTKDEIMRLVGYKPAPAPAPDPQLVLLTEIRDLLKKEDK